ncbi:MAG: hypothetical protein ACRETM_13430 [Stenotrophobium sp.]
MLYDESLWFSQKIKNFKGNDLSPVINLGCGDAKLRNKHQPYIQLNVLSPLAATGANVINTDMKSGDGVDVSGDIFDVLVQEQLRSRNPKSLLCFNILEHVEDRAAFAQICLGLLPPGGLLLVSVPNAFPYHPDPIDSLFRPDPEAVAKLFQQCDVLCSDIVKCERFFDQLWFNPRRIAGFFAHLLVPFPSMRHWKAAWLKIPYLWKRYRVTCVILRKR